MKFSPPFTSVTRWLIVVFGCAVLATAQPMNSPAPTALPAKTTDTIIYPKGTPNAGGLSSLTKPDDNSRSYILVVALVLAAVGGWVMLQRRQGAPLLTRGPRKLIVEETRPLGNRQYLVVASYEDRKFLLGVTAGQIQMLSQLAGSKTEEKS
jgi:flagellar protein FliO/FliZ